MIIYVSMSLLNSLYKVLTPIGDTLMLLMSYIADVVGFLICIILDNVVNALIIVMCYFVSRILV